MKVTVYKSGKDPVGLVGFINVIPRERSGGIELDADRDQVAQQLGGRADQVWADSHAVVFGLASVGSEPINPAATEAVNYLLKVRGQHFTFELKGPVLVVQKPDPTREVVELVVDNDHLPTFTSFLNEYHSQEEEALEEAAQEHYNEWLETAEPGDRYAVSENDHSLDEIAPAFEVIRAAPGMFSVVYDLIFPSTHAAMHFGLKWSKVMQPAPMADAALDELEQLLVLGTKAPWAINTDPKKWVTNDGTTGEEWRANRDNDAALVAALRNSGAGLVARLRAAEARAYPETLTPELDEVLGWPNFSCAGFANAFRAAGHDIPKKAEREQAFVLHWLTGLVLKHGAGWQKQASSDLAVLREKIAVKGDPANV